MDKKYNRQDIISRRQLPKWIKGGGLSLFISTEPVLLKYISSRIGNHKSLIELCCGVGISLIYLEKNFEKLIGVDKDRTVAKQARENIHFAGIDNKTKILSFDISDNSKLEQMVADVVIYDIPYWYDHGKDLLKNNPDFKKVIKDIKQITPNIIIYAPPYTTYDEMISLLGEEIEFLEVTIDDDHNRNVILLGSLISQSGIKSIEL